MQEYAIWRFFPEKAKLRAARRRYRPNASGQRVSAAGSCPLGEALRALGCELDSPRPSAYETATLLSMRSAEVRFDELFGHAQAFTRAWDGRRIEPTDLPRLMGLSPDRPRP